MLVFDWLTILKESFLLDISFVVVVVVVVIAVVVVPVVVVAVKNIQVHEYFPQFNIQLAYIFVLVHIYMDQK